MSSTTTTTQRGIIHAQVDPKQLEQLQTLAKRNDRSLAAELRRAISRHLRAEAEPSP